jgi:AAA15 family ATPase/GTPase
MTELEHIEIEGFKGLEHVEFEPTDINLITGRNNTGKTSFLEAVDLLFNPAHFEKFGDNMDSVINVDYNSSEIQGETTETLVKIVLQHPTVSEAEDYFLETVSKDLEYNVQFSSSISAAEEEKLTEMMRTGVRRTIEEQLVQTSTDDLVDEMILLSTNSTESPYFLGGDTTQGILQDTFTEVAEELPRDGNLRGVGVTSSNALIALIDCESEEVEVTMGPVNISLDGPPNTDSAIFIESTNLTTTINRTDDEQEPIKIDDIGDLIKETELIEDLKTFTLNYLVFEDENGKKDQIPYEFMGDGFKTIVGLLWELIDDEIKNKIVLLEEPETHMHPGYIREVVYFLINLAREEDVQFFITTHDSDFINDFFTENLTDEEEAYLEDEFSLLRMEEDSAVVEDYETASENLKHLHLDLRGI